MYEAKVRKEFSDIHRTSTARAAWAVGALGGGIPQAQQLTAGLNGPLQLCKHACERRTNGISVKLSLSRYSHILYCD